MNRFFVVLSCLATTAFPMEEINDQSELPLLSEEFKEQTIAKIVLPNGLEALLISDPNADTSAACVAVGAGSWADPSEYPGMAHFCEHMLFMGTEKYPDPQGFFLEVANFQGQTNAFTAPHQTVYMFSAKEGGFLHILDQFAHFFIDPLFSQSQIARELHAVDQEFALHKENNGWRKQYVFRETGNAEHPNHRFSTGNGDTLAKIPQEKLKKWYAEHYSAPHMRVAIYSSLGMDVLKQELSRLFGNVPARSLAKQKTFPEPLSSEKQKGHITYIEPFFDQHILTLSWELPSTLTKEPSQSAQLLAYALDRGNPKSLLQKLKKEKLANNLVAQASHIGTTHPYFTIQIELSDIGVQKIDQVTTYVWQALEGLKNGLSEMLFIEKNELTKLHYQYQKRTDAFSYISNIGRSLLDEDLSTYPKKSLIASHYSPETMTKVLAHLTPEECMLTCMAPQKLTNVTYDVKEKWLQTPYTIQAIPEPWKVLWAENKMPNPEIALPEQNPFLPETLVLVPDPELGTIPVCMAESDLGKAFYVRCPEYQTPDATVLLRIFSKELSGSTRSQVLAHLYIDHCESALEPLLNMAQDARINTVFTTAPYYLDVTFSGFSDKIHLLLQEVLTGMATHIPTEEQFALSVSRVQKKYENSAKELPVLQAEALLSSMVHPEQLDASTALLELSSLSLEEFVSFYHKLFETTYCEGLFAGNVILKTAESAWLDVLHSLGGSPYPKREHPQLRALHIAEEAGPYLLTKSTKAQGYGAVLLLDLGDFSFEKRAVQTILAKAIQEPFFDTLRTKQKTGYIANTSPSEVEKRLYQLFFVQSNTHEPEDLLYRFELFLEELCEDFTTTISQERFIKIQKNSIDTLKTQYRNIGMKSALWKTLAFEEEGDFAFVDKRISALEALSYENFITTSREWLSRKNRKRIAALCKGAVANPYTYTPVTKDEFAANATYEPRPLSPLQEAAVNTASIK